MRQQTEQSSTGSKLTFKSPTWALSLILSLTIPSASAAFTRASMSVTNVRMGFMTNVYLPETNPPRWLPGWRSADEFAVGESRHYQLQPIASWSSGLKQTNAPGNSGQVNDVRQIKADEVIERDLSGGEIHRYEFELNVGQFIQITGEQRGIDIVVTLIGPDEKRIVEMDSPNGSQGPEAVVWVTKATGKYQVEVGSLDKEAVPGRYQLRVDVIRVATPPDNDRVAAQSLFIEGRNLMAQGTAESLRAGIQKFEASLPLWRAVNDRQREVYTLSFVGSSYDLLGEYKKALDYYFPLMQIVQAIGDRVGEADALANIGSEYYSLGENQKALDYYNQSLALWRLLENTLNQAPTLNNIALIYNSQGDARRAIDYFYQALPIMRATGNRRGIGLTLANIASSYTSLGENERALDYFNQALPLQQAIGDRQDEGITIGNIGVLYESEGKYQEALNYYKRAREISRDIGLPRGEAFALNNIGGIYNILHDGPRALDCLNQALSIWQASDEKNGVARALSNIGLAHSVMGEKQKALDYFNQALILMRQIGDRRAEAQTLSNIGETYDSLEDKRKALEYFAQALPLRRETEDRRGEARTLNDLGSTSASLGESEKALDYYNRALLLGQTIKDRQLEAAALGGLARCERDLGHLIPAQERIETALSLIETLRSQFVTTDLRTSYFASVQQYYEFDIDLLIRLHESDPGHGYDVAALQMSERARARGLLELLNESRADIRQGVEPQLLARERSLREKLSAKAERQTQLLNRKHTDEQAAVFQKEIEELISQYHDVEARIRNSSPHYAAISQPVPLSLREIQQQLLEPDTLLLEYRLGEDRSFLWAVTRNSLAVFILPKRTEIEATARRVYELLSARNQQVRFEITSERQTRIAKADADFSGAADAMSQIVLAPVAARLGKNRLLIVSDGALHYVPFAALPIPGAFSDPENSGSRSPVAGRQPLMVDHEVINLPSALSLAILRREITGRKTAAKTLAVFADPVFDKDDERVKARVGNKPFAPVVSQIQSSNRSLETDLSYSVRDTAAGDEPDKIRRLPFTRREATQIAALIPQSDRKEALDFAASRATATSAELSEYRYVHFATHGFLNNTHPELSGIVLSLVDESGHEQDGFLRAYEIFSLKLPAELVVLSGCRTGLGKEIKGEGLVGLTRGFMYAGAARVLVSLWDVSDEASAELMTDLYREMVGSKHLRPAAALRAAQIKIRKEKRWQAPYYWAAFVLQGEPR